jgi:hypothetical protein
MGICETTAEYEKWLGSHLQIVKPDLEYKHREMASASFPFLRATFYRWMQIWPKECKGEAAAPGVLGVGDLHVENFGTWRDSEGRLIWGVNDFDEAFPLPYTIDLVRLSTSAHLAIRAEHLSVRRREACDAILEGYREGLRSGGTPFVLDEKHPFLRVVALGKLRDPIVYWAKMRENAAFRGEVTDDAKKALELLLPAKGLTYAVKRRRAGLGSLGRRRLVALAEWKGGPVAREIKAVAPSACIFAGLSAASETPYYDRIIAKSVRVPDPFVKLHGRWIVRRLAPDCSRIELASLPAKRDEARLLHSMGFETANIHLGSEETIAQVTADLEKRPARWLHEASKRMVSAVESDWTEWRKATPK